LGEYLFDNRGEAAGRRTEEGVASLDNFVGGILAFGGAAFRRPATSDQNRGGKKGYEGIPEFFDCVQHTLTPARSAGLPHNCLMPNDFYQFRVLSPGSGVKGL
jgi:hypothetical protein